MTELFSLSGKRALVTGASGGIGGAIAHRFAEAGAQVALSGRREDALEAVKAALAGSGHVSVPFALSDPATAGELWDKASEALGESPDILVNNAGTNKDMLHSRMKPEQWQEVLDTNLSAIFFLSQAALRAMTRARSGCIINISSVVASLGNAGQANYVAAKAGLEGLTRTLAREVAPRGVTVNAVAPGFIATQMTEALPEAIREKFITQIPMGKIGAPDDIAAACVYLAAPAGAWITGQTLAVNGGMLMG